MSDAPNPPDADAEPGDPFTGHLAFLAAQQARRLTTLADRITLPEVEPLGIDVEEMLDLEALEAMASWQGLFQAPRDKRPAELDPDVEGQMKHCLAQFHLRNIGRSERYSDPDAGLEMSRDRIPYGLHSIETAGAQIGHREPLELLEQTNLDAIRSYQRRMRWLIHETEWHRHFSQELKASIRGPLWRYHADEPESQPATGEVPPTTHTQSDP